MWGKGGDWSWGKGTSSGKGAGGSYGKAATPSAPAATPYSKPELKPGDWICPTCGDHQLLGKAQDVQRCRSPLSVSFSFQVMWR